MPQASRTFRFGPFGINVPSGRSYEPGTNTLITAWKTPSGWAVVRDALTMGPRHGDQRAQRGARAIELFCALHSSVLSDRVGR